MTAILSEGMICRWMLRILAKYPLGDKPFHAKCIVPTVLMDRTMSLYDFSEAFCEPWIAELLDHKEAPSSTSMKFLLNAEGAMESWMGCVLRLIWQYRVGTDITELRIDLEYDPAARAAELAA